MHPTAILIINQILNWLYYALLFIKQRRNNPATPSDGKPLPITDYEQKYAKYIRFFNSMTEEEANSNINPVLYDYEKRKSLFLDETNPTETMWKSRIMIENTDHGNILMYYDCYKMSFAYYSDSQTISNKDLHYAALKYVVIYRCRDFFIDMDLHPTNSMLNVLKTEDAILNKKTKSGPQKQFKVDNVFNVNKKNVPNRTPQTKPFTNKYKRIGKIYEFNIAQKAPDKKIAYANSLLFGGKTLRTMNDFFDELDIKETAHTFTPEKESDYMRFKKMRQQSQ